MKQIIKNIPQRLAALYKALVSQSTRRSTPAEARPAHCGNILALLAHLCDMDTSLQLWTLRWLAHSLRNPGAKMATAIIFNGSQGSGKTLFADVIAAVYGEAGARIHASDMFRRFNTWAVGTNMAVVDGDYSAYNFQRLKSLIAAPEITIRLRGHMPATVVNRLNFIFVSSRDDFLPLDSGSRRFTIVEVPPPRSPGFYKAVKHEIDNGGIEAFRDYLLHGLDMGDFNEGTPAPTAHGDRRAA